MQAKFKSIIALILWSVTGLFAQSFEDTIYMQLESQKYMLTEGVARSGDKLVIDRDDNVYVLTTDELFILLDEKLVPNRQYRPLQGKTPLDVTIRSESGELYYLYPDHFLSNTHAGKPY